jgi:site-specific DNA-cytosine methylase
MLNFGDGEKSGLQAAVEVFQSIGYCVKWQILDGADYGKPTRRERVWLVGFKSEDDCDKFLFPKEIPLTTRLYDYLDEDKLPKSGHVDKPFVREMTGTECLRIIGFEDFKTPEKVKNMKNGDEFLAKCAGNSMVVDCLMAIYKQLDISKYGVETETKSELNLDNSTLEAMTVYELSDLITRASSILNQTPTKN